MLAIVSDQPQYLYMLRSAHRRARVLNTPWQAIIRPPEAIQGESRPQLDLPSAIRRKDGEIVKLDIKQNFDHALFHYLRQQIAAGCPPKAVILPDRQDSLLKRTLKMDMPSRLRRLLPKETEVLSILLFDDSYFRRETWVSLFSFRPLDLIYCILAILVATGVIEILMRYMPELVSPSVRNKSLIYLMACVYVAGRFGLITGLITAVGSFLALNLLYISSAYRLAITMGTDATNLVLFMASSAFVAIALGQNRAQRTMFMARAKRLQALFQLHWVTLAKRNRREAVETLTVELSNLLEAEVSFFLTTLANSNKPVDIYPQGTVLSEDDHKALNSCWEDAKTTGADSIYFPQSSWRFEPLVIANGEIGVLGVRLTPLLRQDPSFPRLFTAIADQTAHIVERADLGIMMEESRVREEKTKLRSMLLSSVSHDLKTPLASVIGSLSVFRSMQAHLPEEHRKTLIDTALEEAQRLDSFISNILDMTRLESGDVQMKQEWVSTDTMLRNVLKRLRTRLIRHNVVHHPAAVDIEVCLDSMMTEQVLQNVLDNAAKYTPAGTLIEISSGFSGRKFQIYVRDHGGGIPAGGEERIFDKFTRLTRTDSQIAGTGLGLAIGKSVMEAQMGSITAANHPEGGAIFTLTMPKWRKSRTHKSKDAA